jgi:hypothetical protein
MTGIEAALTRPRFGITVDALVSEHRLGGGKHIAQGSVGGDFCPRIA